MQLLHFVESFYKLFSVWRTKAISTWTSRDRIIRTETL